MAKQTIKKRIYYHDTDSGGVVYYANYLKYMEEARTEYLRAKNIDLKKLADQGTVFAVTRLQIRYRSPARYNDQLVITSEISKVGAASLEFNHQIKKDGDVVVECLTKLACLDSDLKPKQLPAELKMHLA